MQMGIPDYGSYGTNPCVIEQINRKDLQTKRIFAAGIDFVFLLILLAPCFLLLGKPLNTLPFFLPSLALFIFLWLYQLICDCLFRGVTLGKKLLGIRITYRGTVGNLPVSIAFLHSLCKSILFCIWPVTLIVFLCSHYSMPYDRPLKLQTAANEKKLSSRTMVLLFVGAAVLFILLTFSITQSLLRQAAAQKYYIVQDNQICSFSAVCEESRLTSFRSSVSRSAAHLEYSYWINDNAPALAKKYAEHLVACDGFRIQNSAADEFQGGTILLEKASPSGNLIFVSLYCSAHRLKIIVHSDSQSVSELQTAA
ncbi:MAG: RDD family protein [Firmicutes bacterium]|nr:RDD family protein [Bacillota bacterium]